LNRRIWRSRWRVGWWETSARLFSYRAVLEEDIDHVAPLGQEIFDLAEAQTEAVVEPHGMTRVISGTRRAMI
jgi:hypothetical protein